LGGIPESDPTVLTCVATGIVFGAWKTRGFRGELVNFEIPREDEA
jgi:hypothetical protein